MKRTPLYEQIKLYIKQLIADNAETDGYTLPSESQLVQSFSVSRITAKRTLDDLEAEGLVVRIKGKGTYISPEITPQKAIALLNQPDKAKSKISTKNVLSVIVPDFTSRYYINIISGIFDCTEKHDWLVQIANTNVQREREIEAIRKTRLFSDGMIICPIDYKNYDKDVIRLSLRNYPFCFIDNNLLDTNIPCVLSDNIDAMHKATSYLIEKGKKNIAYITLSEAHDLSLQERLQGYLNALNDFGIERNDELIKNSWTHVDIFVNDAIEKFLTEHPEVDGIITSICGIGIKTAQILLSLGNRELLDNLIIFDDEFDKLIDLLAFRPKFIRQDARRIGYTAAEIAIKQHDAPDNAIRQTIVRIPTEQHFD